MPQGKLPSFGWGGNLSPICFHKIKIPCIFSMGPVGGSKGRGEIENYQKTITGMNEAIFLLRFSQHILVVSGWCSVMERR